MASALTACQKKIAHSGECELVACQHTAGACLTLKWGDLEERMSSNNAISEEDMNAPC